MLLLQSILSQETIQKLGWTLIHFIWQAAAAALLLAIILRLLRKSSPSLRYIIACLALALVVLLPVITIGFVPVSSLQPAAQIEPMPLPAFIPAELTPSLEITVPDEPTQPESTAPATSESLIQRADQFFEPALPYIVLGWLIGVFGLSLWHLGGWAQLQHLRRKLVKKVDDTLYSKLDLLARRLRLNQTVQLLESALVQIPTVVGWLRPVILLPASALTGLTSEQLEAILAHELAHIKRYDYLVNILQTIVEILGFYHPAVWWISHKIRAERENCCDDLAVSISGDRVCYARALTSMEEIRTTRGRLAVAATGGSLFQRIYRLVGKDSTEKTGSSWIPAATAILLILAIIIPTALALSNKSQLKENEQTQLLKLNTLPDGWIINYSSMWPSGMARDLVQLRALPTPANEYDESWKEERLEFRISALNGEIMGSILFWGEHNQSDRITLSPNKYLLSYTRERQDPKTSCLIKMNHVEFPVDLSRRGMYTLVFSPKLEQLKTTDNKFLQTTCTGRVLNSKGDSLASARVEAYEIYFDMAGNVKLRLVGESVTKADGNFLFETSPSVKKSRSMGGLIIAQKEGLAIGWAHWPLYDNQRASITLQEPTKLSGKIVDENGKPIPNAEVRAVLFENKTTKEGEVSWLPGIQPFNGLSVRTDKNGRFEFDNIPQNTRSDLLVTAPGFGTICTRRPDRIGKGHGWAEFTAGQTDIKITMSIEAKIKGKVVNKKTGEGIAGVTLAVVPHFTSVFFERYLCTTKEDGTFDIGGLRSGKYVIIRRMTSNRVRTGHPTVDVMVESGKTTRNVIIKCPYEVQNPQTTSNNITTPNEPEQESDIQTEVKKALSADKLKWLGLALALYADDNDDNLPRNLQQLKPYIGDEQSFTWLLDNTEYFGWGHSVLPNTAHIPIAYDKTLFIKNNTTNVLFLDFSVRFLETEQLEKLAIRPDTFLIETQVWSISENFLKSIGSKADSPNEDQELSKLKSELLKAHNDSKCLILNAPQVSLLLGVVKAQGDSVRPAALQVMTKEGKTAKIVCCYNEFFYKSGYIEPNNPSDEPKPRKLDKVEEGIFLSLIPKLTPNKNIDMEFELEITHFLGLEEHKYKGKYTYWAPSIQSTTQSTRYIAHNGQTLLLGGHKIPDKKDDQAEQKDLLILITAKTLGFSEHDKSTQPQDPTAAKSDETFIKPGIIQKSIIRPDKNKQESDTQSKATLAQAESVAKLKKLGLAVVMYADDNDNKLPDNLQTLKPYIANEVDYQWSLDNVEYLGKGKTYRPNQPKTPVAYDQTLLADQSGTNVLFMDAHVEHIRPSRLKELGIDINKKAQILIEASILTVDEDFWQDYIEDANLAPQINLVPGKSGPASQTYSLILDDPNADSFLKAAASHKGSKMLTAPRATIWDGRTATMSVSSQLYYVSGYNEPNQTYDKPEPKIDSIEPGTNLWFKPELTSDKQNIKLDFKLEITEIQDHREHTYLDKYTHMVPVVTRVATSTTAVIPNGKTLLITFQSTKEKISMMLVKPTIHSPEQVKTTTHKIIEDVNPDDPLVKKLEKKLKRSAR